MASAALDRLRSEARIGFRAASVASFHRPRQPGVIRAIASTCVASMQNIAAPDSASELICVKCQSLASPSRAEYWHIGATMMRLGSARPRSFIGENRALMWGCPGMRGRMVILLFSEAASVPQAAYNAHQVAVIVIARSAATKQSTVTMPRRG